jgi:hypothetical protein
MVTKLRERHAGNERFVDQFRLENMLEQAYTRVRRRT